MEKKGPSYYHNNRKYYNWLVYDINDEFIQKFSIYYKGDLYDFGCGTKPYEAFFKQYCTNYIGVDWSDTLHELKADIVGDLNKPLDLEDNLADTIVSFSVLEHLSEPQNMINEAYRILKKGGVFVLQVPFMWHIHEEPYDFFRFTEYGLRHIFNKAGFKNITIEASSGFWVNWFVKLNYQLTRVIGGNSNKKKILRFFLKIFINKNQKFAKFLDKKWPKTEKETQGYWVVAIK